MFQARNRFDEPSKDFCPFSRPRDQTCDHIADSIHCSTLQQGFHPTFDATFHRDL